MPDEDAEKTILSSQSAVISGDETLTSKEAQETEKPKDKEKEKDEDRKEYRAGNCNDCNRQFCLEYMNLPICKGKGAEEIFTTCFRGFLLRLTYLNVHHQEGMANMCFSQREIRGRMRWWCSFLFSLRRDCCSGRRSSLGRADGLR